MVRWDNILLLIVFALIILAVGQLVTVVDVHGATMEAWYLRAFSPGMRPILWFEVLLLIIVVVLRLRSIAQKNIQKSEEKNHDRNPQIIVLDGRSSDPRGPGRHLLLPGDPRFVDPMAQGGPAGVQPRRRPPRGSPDGYGGESDSQGW